MGFPDTANQAAQAAADTARATSRELEESGRIHQGASPTAPS